MEIWHIWAGLSLLFFIFEMVNPAMFFLNFATGAIVATICSFYFTNWPTLIVIFVFVSLISLLFLRPLLIKKSNSSQETGINAKYIGKTAKVIEAINSNAGVISIYDERWQARSEDEIPAGSKVKIIKNDGLIMYVKEEK